MPSFPHHNRHQTGEHNPGLKRRYGPGPVGRYFDEVTTPSCPLFSMFTFVKCFRQDHREPMPPLKTLIGPKLAPAPVYQAYGSQAAVRHDFVLPRGAPHTIAGIPELMAAFDSVPPLRRDVMVEMKFILRREASPHCAYEAVRGFAFHHFAGTRSLASILVLHQPARSGAASPSHVHLFALARVLTQQGFGEHAGGLVHDQGFEEVTAAWEAWRTGPAGSHR